MLQEDAWPLAGADLALSGNVPQGAGLSSSASLQVALGQGFKQLLDLASLTQQRIAQLAQRAENRFVGVACGIMDQLVSACGQAGHALRIDCRSLHTEAVPLPAELALLIVHSRVRRGLVESAYNERRQQCEAAARHFGVAALRDLDEPTLHGSRHEGLDPLSWRRARHVVGENARVLQAAKALARWRPDALGAVDGGVACIDARRLQHHHPAHRPPGGDRPKGHRPSGRRAHDRRRLRRLRGGPAAASAGGGGARRHRTRLPRAGRRDALGLAEPQRRRRRRAGAALRRDIKKPEGAKFNNLRGFRIGRRDWTRTNDPHHVKVVL
jgi:hypothetical protein